MRHNKYTHRRDIPFCHYSRRKGSDGEVKAWDLLLHLHDYEPCTSMITTERQQQASIKSLCF